MQAIETDLCAGSRKARDPEGEIVVHCYFPVQIVFMKRQLLCGARWWSGTGRMPAGLVELLAQHFRSLTTDADRGGLLPHSGASCQDGVLVCDENEGYACLSGAFTAGGAAVHGRGATLGPPKERGNSREPPRPDPDQGKFQINNNDSN